jgi:putative FmdB family regulatory protein
MALTGFAEGGAMPTYEYQCDKCGKRFAVIERISEHTARAPACPKCRSRSTRQLPAAFYAKTVKKS